MSAHPKSQDLPVFALGDRDPDPVEIANPDGQSPFVIICEHAGRAIPQQLGDLGLDDYHLGRHIAWDIGAEGVSRALAQTLDASVVFQRYSRLVIDCNRPVWAEDSIPEMSDGTPVPANIALSPEERAARVAHIHTPFHDAVEAALNQREGQGRKTVLIALHSFTPCLAALPAPRPWHLGILFNRDASLSRHVHSAMEEEAAHLTFTYNEPYEVNDHGDYTIPIHGEQRGIPHSLFEIRNDHIVDRSGQLEWAGLLTRVLRKVEQRM